ncbi:MAG: DUF4910 domain-containing protein [Candidatus Omnitrophica bacterium]|nr:DUF4910 domain-containing protein [Candidatus Omnitrophota bacterium]
MFKPILEAVQREFSGQAAKDQVAIISQYHRIQASPGYRDAATHCQWYLTARGVSAVIHAFPATNATRYWSSNLFQEWDASEAMLHLLKEDGTEEKLADYRDTKISLIQRSTPFDGEVEVVVLEDGEEEADYDGLDVAGKIVLTRGDIHRVYQLAVVRRGAVGILFDGIRTVPTIRESLDLPDARQYTSFWWSEGDRPCFGFVLSPRQGLHLRRRAAEKDKPVPRVRAHVQSRLYDGMLEVVSALIEGETDEEVILTAYLCHPQHSCNDNASGAAVAMETARTLNTLIQQGKLPRPKRSILFLWVPEITGTYAYLATHEDDIPQMIAGLNLDMVGENQDLCKSSFLIEQPPMSMPSFAPALIERVREDLISGPRSHSGMGGYPLFRHAVTPFTGGSDHYILSDPSVGVPTPMLIQWPDKFYHTSEDTLDKVDPAMLTVVGDLAATYLYFLANAGTAEATWLGYEMAARYRRDLTKTMQAIITEAMATETGPKLSEMVKRAHARAGFMRHHAQQATASLTRLSQDMGNFVAGLQQRIEDFTTEEVGLTSEALRRRGEALGISALAEPSDREEDTWETRARHLIPRRVYRGPVAPGRLINRLSQEEQDAWHRLLKEHAEAPRVLPVVALFWADGQRTLSQIAELVELETGHRDTELLVRYFEFLAQVELIELKSGE